MPRLVVGILLSLGVVLSGCSKASDAGGVNYPGLRIYHGQAINGSSERVQGIGVLSNGAEIAVLTTPPLFMPGHASLRVVQLPSKEETFRLSFKAGLPVAPLGNNILIHVDKESKLVFLANDNGCAAVVDLDGNVIAQYGAPNLREAMRFLPGDVITMQVPAGEKIAYCGSRGGRVFALDLESGKVLWDNTIDWKTVLKSTKVTDAFIPDYHSVCSLAVRGQEVLALHQTSGSFRHTFLVTYNKKTGEMQRWSKDLLSTQYVGLCRNSKYAIVFDQSRSHYQFASINNWDEDMKGLVLCFRKLDLEKLEPGPPIAEVLTRPGWGYGLLDRYAFDGDTARAVFAYKGEIVMCDLKRKVAARLASLGDWSLYNLQFADSGRFVIARIAGNCYIWDIAAVPEDAFIPLDKLRLPVEIPESPATSPTPEPTEPAPAPGKS
jgi:hypothetical protein